MILTPPIMHPLHQYRLLLFDADGTLRETVVDGVRQARPPNNEGEWQLLAGVREVLQHYDWTQVACGMCSNQGGIALKYVQEHMAWNLLLDCASLAFGGSLARWQIGDRVRMCPHAPQALCPCRKPSPWMLLDLIMRSRRHAYPTLTLSDVLYVGDQDSDREAAERCGVAFCWAQDFFGWRDAPC